MWEPPPQFSLFRAQRIPFGEPGCQGRFPGFTKLSQDRTETRIKLKVARGQVARFCIDSAIAADVAPNSIYSTKCARASRALRARSARLSGALPWIHESFPGSYGNSNKTQGPGGASCPLRRFFRAPWGNSRSWPVLASAIRRDWFVRNSKCFCRSFHLSRNDGIASKIIARDPF